MKQTVLARHELYEASVRHDAAYSSLVYLSHFRDCYDGLYLSDCCIDGCLVGTAHLNLAYAILFFYGDGGAGLFLHALDNLSARANHSTDELLGYSHLLDAWYVGLQVCTRLVQCLHHLAQDMLSACLCLHEGLLQNFI